MPHQVLFIFGTRPEFLKLYPVIREFQENSFDTFVCNTGQHKELVDELISTFDLKVNYSLHIMKNNQSLFELSGKLLEKLGDVFSSKEWNITFVQGDTSTAFFGALASYYSKVPVAHIEAGLRSGDIYAPFPEEGYRKFITQISSHNFVPTQEDATNVPNPIITGNTIVDMVRICKDKLFSSEEMSSKYPEIDFSKKLIVITTHRRENFQYIKKYTDFVKHIVSSSSNYEFVYSVHPNPNICSIVERELSGLKGVHLYKSTGYCEFMTFISMCHLIITDSGGIQEEAPSFGKPVIILRDLTERKAASKLGFSHLAGADARNLQSLFEDINKRYSAMTKWMYNPYGDGYASRRIVEHIQKVLS